MSPLKFTSIVIICLFVSVLKTKAQDSLHHSVSTKPETPTTSSKYVEYFFAIQAGTLVGCNSCDQGKDVTFSGSTIHGVTVGRKFRAGLGLGIDSYQNWQTFPMFVSASWDLFGNKSKNALFIQMAYGAAHPWFVRRGSYANYAFDPFSKVSGGRMINPQLGYRIKYHDLKLSLVVGYKFQRIFYSYNSYPYYCLACDLYNSTIQTNAITQDMSRVQLSMSVGWK